MVFMEDYLPLSALGPEYKVGKVVDRLGSWVLTIRRP
jgi:hypothetical protein